MALTTSKDLELQCKESTTWKEEAQIKTDTQSNQSSGLENTKSLRNLFQPKK